jgi:hypothetical protein
MKLGCKVDLSIYTTAYTVEPDGRKRPLGIAALEDKIVQQAVVTILNQIYEVDFQGFSKTEGKLSDSWKRFGNGWLSSDWNYIRRKPD